MQARPGQEIGTIQFQAISPGAVRTEHVGGDLQRLLDDRDFDSSQALHQTCLAHLLRRCREMMAVAPPGGAQLPSTVKDILQAALQLRDRRDQGEIREPGLPVARGQLEARMGRVLQRHYRAPANQRLANHLLRERDALFTFLYCPGLEATNYRAEQAIRPMVVTRKVWGGNRTPRGAQTQSILVSILHTCRQQLRPAVSVVARLLRSHGS